MFTRAPLVVVEVVEVVVGVNEGTVEIVVCGEVVMVGVTVGPGEDWRSTFCANPTLN